MQEGQKHGQVGAQELQVPTEIIQATGQNRHIGHHMGQEILQARSRVCKRQQVIQVLQEWPTMRSKFINVPVSG